MQPKSGLNRTAMAERPDHARLSDAQARIAAAMQRVERAAAYPRVPVTASGLVERHERLREEVTHSLADLAKLIAALERKPGPPPGDKA